VFSETWLRGLVVGENGLGITTSGRTGMRSPTQGGNIRKLYKEVDLNPIVSTFAASFQISALSSDDADEHRYMFNSYKVDLRPAHDRFHAGSEHRRDLVGDPPFRTIRFGFRDAIRIGPFEHSIWSRGAPPRLFVSRRGRRGSITIRKPHLRMADRTFASPVQFDCGKLRQ